MAIKMLQLAATTALLGLVAIAEAHTECGSSVMFGAPWQPNNPYYIQEASWRTHGPITKLNLYIEPDSGCLVGIKPTYGWQAANARLLGVEKAADGSPLQETDMSLETGEYFNKADFKFGGCITYMGLHTNTGRVLSVGDPESSGPLQTSVPDAEDGFLAYIRGFTDEPMTSASTGRLQQLQFVWAAKVCAPSIPSANQLDPLQQRDAALQRPMAQTATSQEPVVEAVTEDVITDQLPAGSTPGQPAAEDNVGDNDVITTVVTEEVLVGPVPAGAVTGTPTAEAVPLTTTPAAAAAVPPVVTITTPATVAAGNNAVCSSPGCSDGTCPTSSCALNGLGKEAVTMKCFGTNIVPSAMLDLNIQNACTNLACKLDKPNCTSTGLLGIGGFCTGRVVAMGTASKLHPSGKAFLGYPCLEYKGLISQVIPVIGDYTAKGTYIAKAWKVCDCINGPGLVDNSIAFRTHKGGSITIVPPRFPTLPHFPFLNRSLINMSMPDVLAQWVVANQNEAEVPSITIGEKESKELQRLLMNFTVPAVLIPKISVPLLKLPERFSLPVFTIPLGNNTLTKVAEILPSITSLPTIVVPKWKGPTSWNLPKVQLPEVTITNLDDLAQDWGVPTMPKLPPLFRMNFSDVASQWLAANQFQLPVPRITLPDFKVGTLRNIIPDFRVPSLVVPNISLPLLNLPRPFALPVFTIPDDEQTLQAVTELVPKINSLPQIMLPSRDISFRVPTLSMPNVTVQNFQDVVSRFGAMIPRPKMPSFSGFNFTMPNFSIPRINLPFPSSLNFSTPQIRVPDLSSVVTAVNNMPDLNIDWSQLPAVLDSWKERYLNNPQEFDWNGFLQMLRSHPALSKLVDGFELSLQVPEFLAPWVAAISQQSQLQRFNVPKHVMNQLKRLIPGLSDMPSLLVVNVTSPYLRTDQPVANLSTVIIPDEALPQVHQLLPTLTNLPSLLIPDGETVSFNITLPEVTAPDFLKHLSASAGAAATEAPAAVTETPVTVPAAAATQAPAAVTETPVAVPAAAAAAGPAPEETLVDTTPDEDEEDDSMEPAADDTTVTPSDGPTTAGVSQDPAMAVIASPVPAADATTAEPVVTEEPPAAATDADAAIAPAPVEDVAPVAASDAPVAVAEVPEESVAAAGGTFTPAPATAGPAAAAAAGTSQNPSNKRTPSKTQTQKPQSTEFELTGEQIQDVMKSALGTDDEGALILDMEGPGIETAFMDPKEFYALDASQQQAMKAMFLS